jgi:hypothetical protein
MNLEWVYREGARRWILYDMAHARPLWKAMVNERNSGYVVTLIKDRTDHYFFNTEEEAKAVAVALARLD